MIVMNQIELDIEWKNKDKDPRVDLRLFPNTDFNLTGSAFTGKILMKINNDIIGFHETKMKNKDESLNLEFHRYFEEFIARFLEFCIEALVFLPISQNMEKKYTHIGDEIDLEIVPTHFPQFKLKTEEVWQDFPEKEYELDYYDFKVQVQKIVRKARDYLLSVNNPRIFEEEWFKFTRDSYELFTNNFFETFPQRSTEELEIMMSDSNYAIQYYAKKRYYRLVHNEEYNGNFYSY